MARPATCAVNDDLRVERLMTPTQVWAAAERRLARDPARTLNTAYEVCDRWSGDDARLAVIVRHPDGRAAERWTYAQMARASSRLATALTAGGLGRGDRVAAVLPQGIEAHIAALAVWRMGAVFVPVYSGFGAEGLGQRLQGSEPSVVIVDAASRTNLQAALAEADLDPVVIAVGDQSVSRAGEYDFWSLIERHDARSAVVDTAARDTATLIFTSGTTGFPKGCQVPHAYLLTMQPFIRHSFALTDADLLASTSSPGWVNGLYTVGACVSAQGRPRVIYTGRFDPQEWVNLIVEEEVSYLSSAPSALRQLVPACAERGFPATLRRGASAGEHQGAELAALWARYCEQPLQDSYGTTETGLALAALAYAPGETAMGALPPVLPGFEVALLDKSGQPQEDIGIVAVRNTSYFGCTGYVGAEQKWKDRWRDDWFLTGDLAKRDEFGQLWFQGRDDDLIVTSGYNVGPTEVEAIVMEHPDVSEVAVVAAPDATRGSVVRAVIVSPSPAQDQVRADVQQMVRNRLGRHAYPRIVDFVDELPHNQAGKILRNVLRNNYLTAATK
jgi:acetyl-CoA synthetase